MLGSQMLVLALVITVGPMSAVAKEVEEANPIRKVVDMLYDMQKELETEADTEKETFEKALCMCEAGKKELGHVISVSDGDISAYTSKVKAETAGKSSLASELEAHKADLAQNEQSLATQTALREKDHAAFVATEADCKTNIEQLGKAIALFGDGAASASFLQTAKSFFGGDLASSVRNMVVNGKLLDFDRRQTMLAFLEQGEDATEPTAPVAELVGIMKSMHDEISADLADATKTEQTDAGAFFNMKESKKKHMHQTGEIIIDKTKRHGALALSLAQSKDALDDAQTEYDDATKYLAALTAQCDQKEADRVRRVQMRNDELKAISEAIHILGEDDALDNFKKALPRGGAFISKPHGYQASLLQKAKPVLAVAKHHAPAQAKVMLLSLKSGDRRPTEKKSATEFSSGASKVVHFMIDEMVEQLHNDDVDDEHKKDFCVNETESFTQLQADKEALDEELTTTIEKLTEDLSALSADIKLLEESIHETDQDTLKATALRKAEHQEFTESFSAMDTSTRLIDRAATKLQDVYSPKMMKGKRDAVTGAALEGAGLSFAQRVDPIVIPDTPDVYVHKESGGVIGLMNQLKEEIAADMKEAQINEKHSSSDYTKVMHEAAVSRANDVKTLNVKNAQHAELSEQKQNSEELLALTKQEVLNIIQYLRQLDIECTFLMKNFESRHDSRVGEESGLENAETIVTGNEPPTHKQIEEVYEEEHSKPEVEEHFPDVDMKKVMPK
jgi:hypothetical protein